MVLSFGCGVVERIGLCCILLWILNISCSVSPVLCFFVGACYSALSDIWINFGTMLCLNFQDRCESIVIVKHVYSKLFVRHKIFKMIVNNIESLVAYSLLYFISLQSYCFSQCCCKVHITYPQVPEVERKYCVLILLST